MDQVKLKNSLKTTKGVSDLVNAVVTKVKGELVNINILDIRRDWNLLIYIMELIEGGIVDKLVDSKTAEKLDKTETTVQIVQLLIPSLTPTESEDVKGMIDFIIQNDLIKAPTTLTKQLNSVKSSFFSKK